MFPTEEAATKWFEEVIWNGERCCGHCGSLKTSAVPRGKPMPYWCADCRNYFSVRTGTPMAHSKIKLRKWVIAIYLCLTSLKSVSSMKLHRDIGVTQASAWFMLHRIRLAWAGDDGPPFSGPVEVDESYFGGKRRNMSLSKRKSLTGRGPKDKTPVVAIKDRRSRKVRAKVVKDTDQHTLQGFVMKNTTPDSMVYTDDAAAYNGLPHREAVKHSTREYVRGMAHVNGVEKLLEHVEASPQGDIPQALTQTPTALRRRVCREAQHPGSRNPRPDVRYHRALHRSPASLPGPHRGQRPQLGRAVVAAERERAPASLASRPARSRSGTSIAFPIGFPLVAPHITRSGFGGLIRFMTFHHIHLQGLFRMLIKNGNKLT